MGLATLQRSPPIDRLVEIAKRSLEKRFLPERQTIKTVGAKESMEKKRKGRFRSPHTVCRNLVVVGTSAGGTEALRELVGHLSPPFPASVLIVLHIPPHPPSMLAEILGRRSSLPVRSAKDLERLRPGHIYVARPDMHLLVEGERMRVVHGPRENRHRPAVDTLFRSAAANFQGQVVGVLLTGNLNDGTAGLWAIKRAGGLAIVQDPKDAEFPGMPSSAVSEVHVDHVVPLREISILLQEVLKQKPKVSKNNGLRGTAEAETRIEAMEAGVNATESLGKPSSFTCPECNGALWTVDEKSILRFRCRTGHSFTAESLDSGISEEVERGLWTALRALGEKESLLRELANKALQRNQSFTGEQFQKKVREVERAAKVLQRLLIKPTP